MKSKNIAHRDLKAENVLCATVNHRTVFKVCDFGLARELEHSMIASSVGALVIRAPEILFKAPQGTYSDLWALGMLMVYCVKGAYIVLDPMQIASEAALQNLVDHLELPASLSESVASPARRGPAWPVCSWRTRRRVRRPTQHRAHPAENRSARAPKLRRARSADRCVPAERCRSRRER